MDGPPRELNYAVAIDYCFLRCANLAFNFVLLVPRRDDALAFAGRILNDSSAIGYPGGCPSKLCSFVVAA